MNLQSSFTYDNFGRRTLRTLQQDNTTVSTAGRSYDTFGRIASISNGTDTLSYTYRPGGQLSIAGWTNGQNAAMSNQSYEYDQYNRLTEIKLNNVNEVSYTLNAKDQRTAAMIFSGRLERGQKKWRLEFLYSPAILKRLLS